MCYDLSPTLGASLCSCECAILMHCINNLIYEQLLPELKRFNMCLCVSLSGLGLYNICQISVQRRTLMLKAVFKSLAKFPFWALWGKRYKHVLDASGLSHLSVCRQNQSQYSLSFGVEQSAAAWLSTKG